MRKGIAESGSATIPLDKHILSLLRREGYKYVQVKGLTADNHYDYVEPNLLVLLPIKELPNDPSKKDIYTPINSEILQQWIDEKGEGLQIRISNNWYSQS